MQKRCTVFISPFFEGQQATKRKGKGHICLHNDKDQPADVMGVLTPWWITYEDLVAAARNPRIVEGTALVRPNVAWRSKRSLCSPFPFFYVLGPT